MHKRRKKTVIVLLLSLFLFLSIISTNSFITNTGPKTSAGWWAFQKYVVKDNSAVGEVTGILTSAAIGLYIGGPAGAAAGLAVGL